MATLFKSSFLEELFLSVNQISDAPPPNPFPHLSSSFSTPTTREVIGIKDAIGNCQEESIEKLLSRLRDVERALQARLDAEHDYKFDLRGMLSTMRLLPPEVLSTIFLMCLPDEIENYSSFMLDRSIPWSISRVCQKWRYVCRSTPRLWVNIPIIREYKSGFFELIRTTTELSFPHDIKLCLRGINAETIQRFENILPRVYLLDVHVDLPMIKGLIQRKESFKRLKSAIIYFTSNSPEEPPTLDFLSSVTSLCLSCRDLRLPLGRNSRTLHALLRSADCYWPNLTKFCGDRLPPTFLRRILFAAPLLRVVTMNDFRQLSLDSGTASSVWHANLKYLSLTCESFHSYLPCKVFQYLHLPGLENLHVEYKVQSPENFLSFLRETHGSLVKLTLNEPLQTLDDQREMYTLCPALKTFTLVGRAKPQNLGILVMSPKLCPTLCHLTLHDLVLRDDDDARILESFCSSRGLVPFSTPPIPPAGLSQLDSITLYPKSVSLHCRRVDRENYN